MPLPKYVTLVEVGPRDGLQNEAVLIPTAVKIELINRLAQTGLRAIEVTSFVSPRWVPQLSDHTQVCQRINPAPGVDYSVLVPNLHGYQNATAAGIKHVAVFTAASETFCQKNINCSISESLSRFTQVIARAKREGIKVRAYLSCALGCPYEGVIAPKIVAQLAKQLMNRGCAQVSLGDTMGIGTPGKVSELIIAVANSIPRDCIAVHFHDTYGQAIANIFASLQQGITTIDSSVAGLGGCPYAPSAAGNVATEDVVYLLNGLGITSGVDLRKLCTVGTYICNQLHRSTHSKVAMAMNVEEHEESNGYQ